MGIDISKLQGRLKNLSKDTKQKNLGWRPKPGDNTIRIVPYQYDKSNPFLELYMHYGKVHKSKQSLLSLHTFNEPDPFVELAEEMRSKGDKDSYKLSKLLEPKLRVYVPVLVRGEESEGVRFWNFGTNTYQDILNIITDSDYGDITDPKTGTDLKVTFLPAKKDKKNYPEYDGPYSESQYGETKITPKRNSSILTEDENVANKIKNHQPKIEEVYAKSSYEELRSALEKFLAGLDGSEDDSTHEEETTKSTSKNESKDEVSDEDAKTKANKDKFKELFGD
jgi:hypothetical protein